MSEKRAAATVNSTKRQGTQDELEILALIVLENLPIKTVVMNRLKETKARVAARAAKVNKQNGTGSGGGL